MENIYVLMSKIMGKVGAIEKKKQNKSQGYAFRGIEDALFSLQKILAEHGVFFTPKVIEFNQVDRPSKSGGINIYSKILVEFTFYGPQGDYVKVTTAGEAMDNGDKSVAKAMSVALKYCLFHTFCIPTESDSLIDTENLDEIREMQEYQNSKTKKEPIKAVDFNTFANSPITEDDEDSFL